MNPQPEYRDEERLDLPSASALEIAVSCPGSNNLRRAMPIQAFAQTAQTPADEWAEKGTRIHKAFETDNTLELDVEEMELYQQGVRFNDMIVENWVRSKAIKTYTEGPRELRSFLLNPVTLAPVGSAKLDRHYLAPPYLLVVDLKSGWNPNLPPPARSWQLKFQGIVMWKEEYADLGIEEIRVAYCKPKDEYSVNDVCDYGKQDMEYSLQSVFFHLWETTQPDAVRHAGHWCNWCPCKAWCPEAGAYSMLPSVIAKRVTGSELMPWEMMVQQMVGADLVKILEMGSIVHKIIEAVKARLKGMTADELALLDLMLPEKGSKADSITDVAGAFQFLSQIFTAEDIFKCLEFNKGRLAELVSKEKGTAKANAGIWLDTHLDKFITRAHQAPSLRRLKG